MKTSLKTGILAITFPGGCWKVGVNCDEIKLMCGSRFSKLWYAPIRDKVAIDICNSDKIDRVYYADNTCLPERER